MSAQSTATARALIATLAQARKEQGLTAESLAPCVGRAKRALSLWERGGEFPGLLRFTGWAEGLGYRVVLVPEAAQEQDLAVENERLRNELARLAAAWEHYRGEWEQESNRTLPEGSRYAEGKAAIYDRCVGEIRALLNGGGRG